MIEGYPPIYCEGWNVEPDQKVDFVYEPSSNKPFQLNPGDLKYEWSLDDVRDHASLDAIAERCVNEGWTFPMVVTGDPEDGGDWVVIDTMVDCYLPPTKRKGKRGDPIKRTVKGYAMDRIPGEAEFD